MNQSSELQKTFPAIDWIKFLFALAIIGIHTGGFADSGLIHMGFGVISRLAVPAFFVISGFLFFRKEATPKRLIHYIKRCGLLYIVFSIIFFIEDTLILNNSDTVYFLITTLKKGFQHLWFLYALIVGVCALFLVHRFIHNKYLIGTISLCLLIAGYLLNTYGNVIGLSINGTILKLGIIRGLFEAVPALTAGMILAKKSQPPSIKRSILAALICLIFLCAETFVAMNIFHVTSTVCWLFTIPCVYYILDICTAINIPHHTQILRKSTTLIYLIHPVFVLLFAHQLYGTTLKNILMIPAGSPMEKALLFTWVSAMTIITVLIIYFCSKTRYGRFLNHIM